MHFLIGSCAYVLPASLIYTRYHTKKGAGVSIAQTLGRILGSRLAGKEIS